jgi:hypothetical protein
MMQIGVDAGQATDYTVINILCTYERLTMTMKRTDLHDLLAIGATFDVQ